MGLEGVSELAFALYMVGARGILTYTKLCKGRFKGQLEVGWAWPEDIEIGLNTGKMWITNIKRWPTVINKCKELSMVEAQETTQR